jgi:aminomethyltransferase
MSAFDVSNMVRDYGDSQAEARACRADFALFDFSFMARARIAGSGATEALSRLQPRSMDDLAPGRIRYSVRPDDAGAVAADLTVWGFDDGVFEVMSGRHDDIEDLVSMTGQAVWCEDLSDETAILALQGPGALAALSGLADIDGLTALPYFGHGRFRIAGIDCQVGRLGYTGEKGFELIVHATDGARLWAELARRARPAGFAAIDILRIEAGFILFANECGLGATAADLGIAAFADAATDQARFRLASFTARCAEKSVLWRPDPTATMPREPDGITVTSACVSPVAGSVLGLGVVGADYDGETAIDPNGWFREIRLTDHPLYDPGKRRPRGDWAP